MEPYKVLPLIRLELGVMVMKGYFLRSYSQKFQNWNLIITCSLASCARHCIHETTSNTTPGQSRLGTNGNKRVLYIFQILEPHHQIQFSVSQNTFLEQKSLTPLQRMQSAYSKLNQQSTIRVRVSQECDERNYLWMSQLKVGLIHF